MTCVDCNVTFRGSSYKAHATCISEAQKYEGAAANTKPSAQDDWTALIATCDDAPTDIRAYFPRLAKLGNVPRHEKKFYNFVANSLPLRDKRVVAKLWTHLVAKRDAAKAASAPAAESARP